MTMTLSACCNGQHIPADFGTYDPVEHVESRPCGIKEALISGLADAPAQGEHHRRAHHGHRHQHDGDAHAGWDVRASSPA